MIIKKESALLCDNTSNSIVEDSRNALLEAGVSNSAADLFVRQMVEVLDDYAAFCGEGAGIKYQIRKGLLRMELRILIPGEALNPFTEGSGARKRSYDKMFSLIPNAENAELSYRYGMKCNIISISIPLKEKPKKVIKDPIVWGCSWASPAASSSGCFRRKSIPSSSAKSPRRFRASSLA